MVDEAHRRQGIGTALLHKGESWARRQEAHQLVLTVWTGNELGSEFYAAHGYSPVSRVLAKEL